MLLERIEIEFRIRVATPTHVGDGERSAVSSSGRKPRQGRNREKETEFATIQRDFTGRPIVEASSLRGALKSHLLAAGQEAVAERLFGFNESDETGTTGDAIGEGSLWLRHASIVDATAQGTRELPDWLPLEERQGAYEGGTFLAPGIAINRHTRAAEDGRLYLTEMLAPGTEFEVKGVFWGNEQQLQTLLAPLFNTITGDQTFALGAEAGYGFGRVSVLRETIKATHYAYDTAEKAFKARELADLEVVPEEAAGKRYIIKMHCKGPFFIKDPTRTTGSSGQDADMVAMMMDDKTPAVTGKAILQELRRRSEWLEQTPEQEDAEPQRGATLDPGKLTKSQRLFGVTGWRKRLSVRSVKVDWAGHYYAAQRIKLDVFTQGPIDSALVEFDVPANIGVTCELLLNAHKDEDRRFLEGVLKWSKNVGTFRLGHATSAGFGAFEILGIEGMSDG